MRNYNGKNQSHIREINRQLVLELLKEKPLSCKEMADILHLSNTALSKITHELREVNLLKECTPPEKNEVGRRPIRLEINADLGCLAVVNLEKFFVKLFDFAGHILYELTLPSVLIYDIHHLNICINLIKDFLEENDVHCLKAFTVITSGRTNKDGSFIYALRYKNPELINLKKMFEDNFDVPTSVKNDVSLALFSEYQNTKMQKPQSVIMLYIDKGVGMAFAIDGKVYEGHRGFAGEVGLIKNAQTDDILENIISIRALKKLFENSGKNPTLPEIAQSFIMEEVETFNIINRFAIKVADVIIDLLLVLDSQEVLINGGIRCLGEGFLEIIRQEIAKNQYLKTQISYGKDDDSTLNGAFLQAQNLAIANLI